MKKYRVNVTMSADITVEAGGPLDARMEARREAYDALEDARDGWPIGDYSIDSADYVVLIDEEEAQ